MGGSSIDPTASTHTKAGASQPDDLGDRFDSAGYVRFNRVFDASTIDDLRDDQSNRLGRGDALRRFGTHPLIARLAREFLGDEARLFNALVWQYRPSDRKLDTYFNDHTVYDTAIGTTMSCLVALTRLDEPIAMRLVPGAHHQGRGHILTDGQPNPGISTDLEVTEALEPGSMLICSSAVPRRFGTPVATSDATMCSLHFTAGTSTPPIRDPYRSGDHYRFPDGSDIQVVEHGRLRSALIDCP